MKSLFISSWKCGDGVTISGRLKISASESYTSEKLVQEKMAEYTLHCIGLKLDST
jgi:hypothetical protein